jgi:hypothetical protein
VLDLSTGQDVEDEIAIGVPDPDSIGSLAAGVPDSEMRYHGAALLAHAGLIQAPNRFPLEQCRRSQNLIDGDDPGATDTHQVEVDIVGNRSDRIGEIYVERTDLRFGRVPRHHGEERRTIAVEAGVVDVAG